MQLLKDACDRDWKDESPEVIIRIACNALYWRNYTIKLFDEKLTSCNERLAVLADRLGAIEKRLETIGRDLEPLAIKGLIAQTKQEMLIKRERQRALAERRQRRSKR